MKSRAIAKYVRISPFKLRRISNELKNMPVLDAESYLSVLPNKGALILKKVIHSARTNLFNINANAIEEDLYIKKILIDGGSMYKRYHPIARGRAQRILKRTSRILVEVEERGSEL